MKGTPPKHNDRWAEEKGADEKKADKVTLQINLSVSSCVKLFVRPPAAKGCPKNADGKVEWTKSGNKLKGNNPTPFYIDISELSVGGKEAKEHRYIFPYFSYEYEIPSGAPGKTSWIVITDYGGKSKPSESELKS